MYVSGSACDAGHMHLLGSLEAAEVFVVVVVAGVVVLRALLHMVVRIAAWATGVEAERTDPGLHGA